ncbi:MAG: aspartyl-phosphate phosphatase Spo0E family protein [Moorellaceae bacterium]
MNLGTLIVRIERERRKLMAVDPQDTEKLLAISRKLDELVARYYRERYQRSGNGSKREAGIGTTEDSDGSSAFEMIEG